MIAVDRIAGGLAGSVARAGEATSTASGASMAAERPFGGMLQELAQKAGTLETQATDAVGGLLAGKGVEVHEALIATQKADMAFEMALAVRNKAVGAYQQMMQMQF